MKELLVFVTWCGVSFGAGGFGSRFKPGPWYATLEKPKWTPPPIAFPIAWAMLYTMMGVAAALVWQRKLSNPLVPLALSLFIAQLILNALWSWIFFGLHKIGWAFFEISLLWVFIFATLCLFLKISLMAGVLIGPYLLWVSFATVLNGAIWKRNKDRQTLTPQ